VHLPQLGGGDTSHHAQANEKKSDASDLGPDASKFTSQQRKYFEQVDEAYGPQAEHLVGYFMHVNVVHAMYVHVVHPMYVNADEACGPHAEHLASYFMYGNYFMYVSVVHAMYVYVAYLMYDCCVFLVCECFVPGVCEY
jgi:hypothetical protein